MVVKLNFFHKQTWGIRSQIGVLMLIIITKKLFMWGITAQEAIEIDHKI